MGLFSTIKYEGALPDGAEFEDGIFQTKHLINARGQLVITAEGRLHDDEGDTEFHGLLNFYNTDASGRFHDYWAKFTDGSLEAILLENPMSFYP